MKKFLYQWGGSIVMVAGSLIGIFDSFSAARGFVAWVRPFGMRPIHLAFWLLGAGAFYTTIIQGLRISRWEKNAPNIIFNKAGEWQFYTNGQATYHALQIWFINKPKVASDVSMAKDVTATIKFYDRNTKIQKEIFGCFTEPEVPDYATIRNLKDKIDVWSPNAIPQKLLIALKYPGDQTAYLYAKSNFLATQDGRESGKEISEGKHYVEVNIEGIGIEQLPSWFILNNPGQDGDLSIIGPVRKPNLRREGFRTE